MRRRVPLSLAVVVLALFAITVGGRALAYFSGPGSGTASAAVTSLPVPVISAATPAAGGTVTLTWGAVTPPGAGTVSYYVTRDGGKPAGTCPTVEVPAAVITCKDASVPIGEHSYRVIAEWETWSRASAVKTAKVTIGEAVKFTISGSTTTPATGAAVNLTITAKDINNATVTGYTGSHNLVFSGAESGPNGDAPTVANSSGTAIAFGAATALTFTNGVAAVSSSKNGVLKIYKPGVASIIATEGAVTTPTPLALTVAPTATRFVLKAATATPAAGASDDITITAQDAYGNVSTTYTGSHNLVFSGANTSAGGNAPTVTNSSGTAIAFGAATAIEFTAGVADPAITTAGTAVLYKAESASVKATEASITTPTGAAITPTPGAATKLVLTSSTATPAAGSTFNLTTTAQDVYGNTATSYTGSKNITFSGAEASPGGVLPTVVNSAGAAINFGSATALTFTNGVAAVSASKNGLAKLTKAGATSVTASDGTLSTPIALALTVAVGAANRVGVTGLAASAGSIGSPCLLTCAVTGLDNSGTIKAKAVITDSSGNLITNVGAAKTVTITVTAGGTIAGSPLTVPASGSAISGTEFTYTAPVSGSFTHTITLASTGYTSGTVTVSK
jgi:hypothetical protein